MTLDNPIGKSSKFMILKQIAVPPLEGGDRLSRNEFERRYEAGSHIKKAELIEGVIYVAAAVRSKSHGQPHAAIMTWLGTYWSTTPGVDLNDNTTVRLDADNEPQPDALLRIEVGGQSRLTDDDYVEGAPELVAEVAASSAAYDLHDKKQAYQRNGVQEYLVWQVFDPFSNWFSACSLTSCGSISARRCAISLIDSGSSLNFLLKLLINRKITDGKNYDLGRT